MSDTHLIKLIKERTKKMDAYTAEAERIAATVQDELRDISHNTIRAAAQREKQMNLFSMIKDRCKCLTEYPSNRNKNKVCDHEDNKSIIHYGECIPFKCPLLKES